MNIPSDLSTPWKTMHYTWRDCVLYALAVGAGWDEPEYTYERQLQTIPTFGVTPYWGTLNVTPQTPKPWSIPAMLTDRLRPEKPFVNFEHEFLYHRPIPALEGRLVYRDVLKNVYDRGEGRGMLVRSETEVFDGAGNLLCTNRCTTLFPSLGGFGGETPPRRESRIPDRAPDLTADAHIAANQHLLYRLTGDTNLVHIDRETIRSMGLEGPVVHDLCALGFACRLSIAQLFPKQPERLRRLSAAMKTVLYPDTPIQLQLWTLAPGQAAFRLMNAVTGKPILDRGELEWTP